MSAVERAEAALAAIETWEPVVNAFTAVHADDARARAAELDPAAPGAAGPLTGVPVAVKDTLWMAGRRRPGRLGPAPPRAPARRPRARP